MATAEQHAMRYMDPDTGFLMMPGSQRPDGSWRKPRRVREGYTPQDEVPLYESKGKAVAKARESGYIPGLHLPDTAVGNFKIDTFVLPAPSVSIPGLTATPHTKITTSTKSKKKKGKGTSGPAPAPSPAGVQEVTEKLAQASISQPRDEKGQPQATDPAKKLRNLKKKLRDIEALEAKLKSGEIPNPEKEQLEKIARKADVLSEIEQLEASGVQT